MTCAARAPRKGVLPRTHYAHSRKALDPAIRVHYESTCLSPPQATTTATRQATSSPRDQLQGVHRDVAPSTTLLSSELRTTFADATLADASRLSEPPSTICDHASKQSQKRRMRDRCLQKAHYIRRAFRRTWSATSRQTTEADQQ